MISWYPPRLALAGLDRVVAETISDPFCQRLAIASTCGTLRGSVPVRVSAIVASSTVPSCVSDALTAPTTLSDTYVSARVRELVPMVMGLAVVTLNHLLAVLQFSLQKTK